MFIVKWSKEERIDTQKKIEKTIYSEIFHDEH